MSLSLLLCPWSWSQNSRGIVKTEVNSRHCGLRVSSWTSWEFEVERQIENHRRQTETQAIWDMEREKSKERDEERRENNKIPGNRVGARFYNQVPWMQLHLHAEMFVEAERAEALQQFYVFALILCFVLEGSWPLAAVIYKDRDWDLMGRWTEGGKERSGPGFSVQTNKRIHFLAALPGN